MDLNSLTKFLIDSNKAGYSGGEEKKWIKEPDRSTTIPFTKGDFRSHDNFFGGEPYGGRLVVFFKEKPVWIMVYYGWVEESAVAGEVYKILREALKAMPETAPFRGPKEIVKGNFTYSNSYTGNIERYEGKEEIKKDGKIIYQSKYRGGLVDVRGGV